MSECLVFSTSKNAFLLHFVFFFLIEHGNFQVFNRMKSNWKHMHHAHRFCSRPLKVIRFTFICIRLLSKYSPNWGKKSVIWLTIISVFRVQSAQTNRQHTHSNEWVDAGRPSLNSNYLLTLMSNVLLWAPWEITVISFFYRRIANDERISKRFN